MIAVVVSRDDARQMDFPRINLGFQHRQNTPISPNARLALPFRFSGIDDGGFLGRLVRHKVRIIVLTSAHGDFGKGGGGYREHGNGGDFHGCGEGGVVGGAGERLADEQGGRGEQRRGDERAAGVGGEETRKHAESGKLCGAATPKPGGFMRFPIPTSNSPFAWMMLFIVSSRLVHHHPTDMNPSVLFGSVVLSSIDYALEV